ncbi:sigma-54-dependent transcriptional regulator [Deferrisoma camini]|uniref:sigma-54-dependent transcriptional regulator n=1 Tax=Deferrisoma camini TaxID=1035120 RepID=UPI00046CD671|nr:sigma-54 dependent transcriptional regulator [Deferrisoma camini]
MDDRHTVLVVDDDPGILAYLDSLLSLQGYRVVTAETGEAALARLNNGLRPDVVVLDVMMPGMDGLATLRHLRDRDPELPVIMLSGVGRTATVVEAMRSGAYDYIDKSFEADELNLALEKALERRRLVQEIRELRNQLAEQEQLDPIVGVSQSLQGMKDLLDSIADTDVTVLIEGESGVGKELAARRLHTKSSRRRGRWVKVNCAALPPDLLESELFGYEKGAFTGAQKRKVGRFEYADGGTIFLDEIGEMSLPLQAKLLQVLQDREFCRVGGNEPVRVDVRIVCATNRDLRQAVENKEFREDLYYRLNVVNVRIPPLRERREDIPLLTRYFLHKYVEKYGRGPSEISDPLMAYFLSYDWPGNVRELENLVKRLVILNDERFLFSDFRSKNVTPATPSPEPLVPEDPLDRIDLDGTDEVISLKEIARKAAMQAERRMIAAVLRQTNWNRRKAAQLLDISYKTLLYKIRECGLEPGQ